MIPQQTQYPYGVTLTPVRVWHVGSYCSVCFRQVSEFYREWGALASKIAKALKRSLLKGIRIFRTWSRLFDLVVGEFILGLNSWGPHSSLERERKFRQRVFTSSITRRIRKFTSWSCSDGKEMYQTVCCTCKLLFCLWNLLVFTFSLPLLLLLLGLSSDSRQPLTITRC